jgi:predicted aspartyl protease
MAINFPASPTLNQTFSSGNVNYVWDGTKWTASVTGGISLDKIEEGNTSAEVIDTGSDGRFVVTTEGTEKLRVDSNGDVTINDKIVHSGDTNTAIRFPAADVVSVETNGSERLRVDSAGRLLLGTSTARSNFFNGSVSAAFQVEGTNSDTRRVAIISSDTGAAGNGAYLLLARQINGSIGGNQAVTNGDSLGAVSFQGSDGTEFVEGARIEAVADAATSANDVPTRLVLSTTADGASSPTERMRITNSGYSKHKGGGANYYNDTASYHEFTSNQTGSVVLEVVARTSGFASQVIDTVVETTTNNTSYAFFSGSNFNGQRAAIYGNGAYGSSPNTYGSLSDIKLKENITPASSQWNDVKTIEVVNYNLIGEDGKHLGVIAQQAEQVSPGLVDEIPDKDEDGNLTGETTKFVKYSILYMKAVKALQEAMERIETLEAKVAALEGV